MAIEISNPHIPFADLVTLLDSEINSGRLILVKPDVRHIGKTKALIHVARKYEIPILVKDKDAVKYIREQSLNEVYSFHDVEDMLRHLVRQAGGIAPAREVGFLVEEGVNTGKIYDAMVYLKVRTGFFTNYLF